MDFPGWATAILSIYVKKVRPALKRAGWGKGNNDSIFPQEATGYVKNFLTNYY